MPVPVLALLLLLPRRAEGAARWLTLATLLVQGLLFGVVLWPNCCATEGVGEGAMPAPMLERQLWLDVGLGAMGRLRAEWLLGLDGLNVLLVALTLLIMPIAVVASWRVTQSVRGYFALLLLLDVALLGCFLALDLLLFFVFFELMLLPMYFLIGVWGGERRRYAAIKFFLYTLVGSVLILGAILALVFSYVDVEATVALTRQVPIDGFVIDTPALVRELMAGGSLPPGTAVHSFSLLPMLDPTNVQPGALLADLDWRLVAFWLLVVGFAIKLPAVPVHTWLPDAHVEASTPISVILAALLLKVGGYGLLRVVIGIFPEGMLLHGGIVAGLGVLAIIYGALLCLAQQDLKRLVAYSSVSHMGYVLLGLASLTAAGLVGASYQLITHGLNSALLFLLVGVLYDRVHDRRIASFGGLWGRMPGYTAMVIVGFFAGMALPTTAPFVSEFLVFVGAFESANTLGLFPLWLVGLALLGILLAAGYFIWALQRMFFGPYQTRGGASWDDKLVDLTPREWLTLLPLALLIVLLGVLPHLALEPIDAAIDAWARAAYQRGMVWVK